MGSFRFRVECSSVLSLLVTNVSRWSQRFIELLVDQQNVSLLLFISLKSASRYVCHATRGIICALIFVTDLAPASFDFAVPRQRRRLADKR